MLIKKHKNKNDYIVTNGIYVRDFAKSSVLPVDINTNLNKTDHDLIVDNVLENFSQKYQNIDNEDFYFPNIVIVSDGFGFKDKQAILARLPKSVTIIAVNGALKEWRLVGNSAIAKRVIDFYVVNNPYAECMSYLPDKHRYYPRCIASFKTNPTFMKEYQGPKYVYAPTNSETYSSIDFNTNYKIDDYRNPVCAALGLAYRFNVKKILLFCCDCAFDYEKSAATKLENGLWQYPQHELSQKIIDSNLYWLKNKKIEVADYSSGIKYDNATYITNEVDILEYFENE